MSFERGGRHGGGRHTTADLRRPGYHFTAPSGWINDPLGVTWHEGPEGGRYELFYQFNPAAPDWVVECRWGQATGPDLVRWQDPRTALEPGEDEAGCWSGSVAVMDDGTPVIVYTSVLADAPHLGRVALAAGDRSWRGWSTDAEGPVLGAPGREQGLAHFRDPFVWRDAGQWRMVVGAGGTDGRPSVLQFSSPDLRRWRPDGVLAEPGPGGPDFVAAGSVWECPQLFPLEGAWILLVSVWNEVPGGVACAVGEYDGTRFTARSWQRLAADPLYATTTFLDAEGRRCAMSWVQEVGPADGAWAGTLSVPWLLGRDGDRVTVAPHPDVGTLRTEVQAEHGPAALSAAPLVVGPVEPSCDVHLTAHPAGRPFVLALDQDGQGLLTMTLDDAGGRATVAVPGRPDVDLRLAVDDDGSVELRMLVDASVVELYAGAGDVAAVRVRPVGGAVRLAVSARGEGARLDRLVVHGMERPLDPASGRR